MTDAGTTQGNPLGRDSLACPTIVLNILLEPTAKLLVKLVIIVTSSQASIASRTVTGD